MDMIHKSQKPIYVALLVVMGLLLITPGCKPKRTQEEALTLNRVRIMIPWIEDFKYTTGRYPNDWEEVLRWKGTSMEENPYTKQPMVSLSSRDFDPKVSPGNFFYARVIQNDEVVNFTIIVYGARGEIRRISHTAMGAK
jgi:hypothetical protein